MLERIAGTRLRRLLHPLAGLLLRWRVTPDAVTVAGTIGVVVGAVLIGSGHLTVGALAVAVFALADMLDGTMARQSGRSVPWGAFLDSTLDRVSDAAVFASVAYWCHRAGDERGFGLALAVLATAGIVPYARARAESLGAVASDGVAARADRLGVTVLAVLALGLGASVWVLHLALATLLVGIVVTVWQRVASARRQLVTLPAHLP